MFGSSPLRNRPVASSNNNKAWSKTYLSGSLQGKEFTGHSAFSRLREQVGKFTAVNKSVNTPTLKKFILNKLTGMKRYQADQFLKNKLKLNESQREKVIQEISPSGGLTKQQQRMHDRIMESRKKDNIIAAQEIYDAHLAQSETTHISAGEMANLKTGFAGQGVAPKKSGFASGPGNNVTPLTKPDPGVAGSGPTISSPTRHHFDF